MKRQSLQRHHRQTILVTGIIGIVSAIMVSIADMLLNANATSGAAIFAVETYELMAAKTPQPLRWGGLGGLFMLMLMVGYWHWYVGMATVYRWWSSLTLLLLLFGAIGETPFHFYVRTQGFAYQTLSQITDIVLVRQSTETCRLVTGAINA